MKLKDRPAKPKSSTTSQLMILALAGLVMVLMIQVAKAQSGGGNQASTISGDTLQMKMPKKSLARKLMEDTSLSYYQQFLGPTAGGASGQTYNPFQAGFDQPGTGFAPYQSFHAFNLRHQINSDWAIGATMAAVNGYTDAVTTNGHTVGPETFIFNARAYVSVPSLNIANRATLFTTLAYEFPTSEISKDQNMRYGLVLISSLAFNSPNPKLSYGIMGQYYRMFYESNAIATPGGYTWLQTAIISGGPYVNYRFNDKWGLNSLVTFDWDQRSGMNNRDQTFSREFNNNLEDRFRAGLSYYPSLKYINNVGIFTQGLLKYRPETQAFGAEVAMRF
jgi:hypothetical protein